MERAGVGFHRRRALLAGCALGAACLARPLGQRSAAAAEPLPLAEVAPGVFVHVGAHEDFTPENAGGIANLGFVVGERGVTVIDSGGSRQDGERLLAAIRARTGLPVACVIATHVHPDHVFGHAAFAATGAAFVGHAKLPRAMAERGPLYLANMRRLLGPAFDGTELVPPTQTVAVGAPLSIDPGGRRLVLQAWPTAHTDTDLTVLDEATGTLFAGDLLFMERLPIVDGSLKGWLAVMDDLARIPAARVVPGHGPAAAAWPMALSPQRHYLEGVRDGVRAAIARGVPLDEAPDAVPVPADTAWLLADEGHARNVVTSYTELEWE